MTQQEQTQKKYSLRPDTIKDVLETYAMHYQVADDIDAKADITDQVKEFLCDLNIGNESYNFYFSYYERRKEE